MNSSDIMYLVTSAMPLFSWIAAIAAGIVTLCKFIAGIIIFKNPEYYCKNCGRKVDLNKKKCPKCKVSFR